MADNDLKHDIDRCFEQVDIKLDKLIDKIDVKMDAGLLGKVVGIF